LEASSARIVAPGSASSPTPMATAPVMNSSENGLSVSQKSAPPSTVTIAPTPNARDASCLRPGPAKARPLQGRNYRMGTNREAWLRRRSEPGWLHAGKIVGSKSGCADGMAPNDALIAHDSGTLYRTAEGVASSGGAYNQGTIYELVP